MNIQASSQLLIFVVLTALLRIAQSRPDLPLLGRHRNGDRMTEPVFSMPRYGQFYYKSLVGKLSEATSTGSCSISIVETRHRPRMKPLRAAQAMEVTTTQQATDTPYSVIHAFSSSICAAKETSLYFANKAASSCTITQGRDSEKGGKSKIRAGHLHPLHPRCDSKNSDLLSQYCKAQRLENISCTITSKTLQAQSASSKVPFLIEMPNAMLSKSGMVWQQCGLTGLLGSCGAVRYRYVLLQP